MRSEPSTLATTHNACIPCPPWRCVNHRGMAPTIRRLRTRGAASDCHQRKRVIPLRTPNLSRPNERRQRARGFARKIRSGRKTAGRRRDGRTDRLGRTREYLIPDNWPLVDKNYICLLKAPPDFSRHHQFRGIFYKYGANFPRDNSPPTHGRISGQFPTNLARLFPTTCGFPGFLHVITRLGVRRRHMTKKS